MISLVEYKNFKGRVLPKVGVYYLFDNNWGLCKGFSLELLDALKARVKRVTRDFYRVSFLEEFTSEEAIIRDCDRHRYQAVRIDLAGNISFKEISAEIARIHFDKFLEENFWIRDLGI